MKTRRNANRFSRDPNRAKVSGVCAGLARDIGIDPWWVRGIAALAFLFQPVAIALAYVLAIVLLKYRY